MADEPDVVDAPVEDAQADPIMDILTEDEQDTSKAASSPADKKPEVADAKDEAQAPEDAAKEESKDESEEQPQGKAEERKQQLNTEIRDLVAQRNALKTEVEKINGEFYQPATEDQLVAQGLTATDAKLEALNQRLEVKEYNDRVADAQLTIESEARQVLRDYPVFDPESKEYNKALAEQAAEIFNDSLIHDENTGQVIGSNISTLKLYKALASSYNISAQEGQLKGQKATETMLSRADNAGGAAPKADKKDPILAILEDVDGD